MRYNKKKVFSLTNDLYKSLLAERNIQTLEYFSLSDGNLNYPTQEQLEQLDIISYVWEKGDNFMNLAYTYYNNNPEYWWIIAFFNNKPLDQLVKIGDIIYIPTPLEKILSFYNI